jgi:hypothetical protein
LTNAVSSSSPTQPGCWATRCVNRTGRAHDDAPGRGWRSHHTGALRGFAPSQLSTLLKAPIAASWRAANDTHVSAADVAGWAAVLHAAPSPHPGCNPDHAAALAAPWLAHVELHAVFLAFCGEEQCDAEDAAEGGQRGEAWLSRVGFLHLCRECALMDVRMVTAMDLVFAAAIAAPARAGDGAGGDALGFAETVSGTPPFETALHFSSRVSADREPHHWALRLQVRWRSSCSRRGERRAARTRDAQN